MSDYLEYLGLTEWQVGQILAISQKAEDDRSVQRGTIVRVVNGTAIVQRFDWNGAPLPDYPVRVPSR